jgi:CCR4-NOT transcriptional complex subunit CAF120
MFAMPKHKRYGYLEILDVTGLIVQDGSSGWNEREWRKQLKEVTGKRMNAVDEMPKGRNRSDSRQSARSSTGASPNNIGKPKVGFADEPASARSSRSFSLSGPPRTDSAPPDTHRQQGKPAMAGVQSNHVRNSSDSNLAAGAIPLQRNEYGGPAASYQTSPQRRPPPSANYHPQDNMGPVELPVSEFENMRMMATPEPVSRPPAFNHGSQARPVSKVYHSPELRQANSRLSAGTLSQLANAGGMNVGPYGSRGREDGAMTGPSVHPHANSIGTSANDNRSREVLSSTPNQNRSPAEYPPPLNVPRERSRSPLPPLEPPNPYNQSAPGRPSTSDGRRPTYPPPGGPSDQSNRQAQGMGQGGDRSRTPVSLRPGGQPPNARPRSPNPPRQPPNGPIRQGSYDNYSGGYRPNEPPGGFNPSHRKGPYDRNAAPDRHTSTITTNEIIDHYARDPYTPVAERPDADRPRAGVLKTVGGADAPPPSKSNFDLPDINFGPTYNYAATSPPRNRGPQGNPGPQNQGPRPNNQGRGSPGPRPGPGRGDSGDSTKRTLAWQPGGAAPGMGPSGVSAEQYVQQRAAGSQPQYAHARTPSGNVLPASSEATTHTRRRSSVDILNKHGRTNSSDLLQRPNSQGGNSAMNWAGSGNVSSHLSAREQEHMARMTGGPLVNVSGQARGPSPGPGLVGAIDARERERQQMRQGANSHAAQYAMNQHPNQGPPMQYQQPQGQWAMGDRSMSPQPGYRPAYQPSPQSGDGRMPPQGQYPYGPGPGRNQHPPYQGQAF